MPSSIMVAVDRTAQAPERVKFAAELAMLFDARLIGVGAQLVDVPIGSAEALPYTYPDLERQTLAEIDEARETFKRASQGFNQVEWRGEVAPPLRFLLEQSRAADVVVVGRCGPDDMRDRRFGVDPGDVVLGAGRPILLTPPNPRLNLRRIVVGWKDTREARRAVVDALPFLRQAEKVTVVEIASEARSARSGRDVARLLEGHDVNAEAHVVPEADRGVDIALLERAGSEGAGLLVCGAYGHSRLREAVFGGVTRTLIRETGVACLMSH